MDEVSSVQGYQTAYTTFNSKEMPTEVSFDYFPLPQPRSFNLRTFPLQQTFNLGLNEVLPQHFTFPINLD